MNIISQHSAIVKTEIQSNKKTKIVYQFWLRLVTPSGFVKDEATPLVQDKHTLGFQLIDFVHTFNDVMEPTFYYLELRQFFYEKIKVYSAF